MNLFARFGNILITFQGERQLREYFINLFVDLWLNSGQAQDQRRAHYLETSSTLVLYSGLDLEILIYAWSESEIYHCPFTP